MSITSITLVGLTTFTLISVGLAMTVVEFRRQINTQQLARATARSDKRYQRKSRS